MLMGKMPRFRFIDCEKWRKEFGGGVDYLLANFEYVEKRELFEYYPQFYHKIDKVSRASSVGIVPRSPPS